MRGRPIVYTVEQVAWVETNCTLLVAELAAGFTAQFDRHDVTAANLQALRKRNGWSTGRNGRFPPGNVPATKGKRRPFNVNSATTQFRKGNLPHNTRYLGHERLTREGYVEISVAETNKHTGFDRRYVLKHRHVWEQANGPLADGIVLKCLSDDKANTDPSNWEPVPRAILPVLNGGPHKRRVAFDTASLELKSAILAIAKLRYRAKTLRTAADRGERSEAM